MNTKQEFFDRKYLSDQLVDALYERLQYCKDCLEANKGEDYYDLGVSVVLRNEQRWLESLLDKVERSR